MEVETPEQLAHEVEHIRGHMNGLVRELDRRGMSSWIGASSCARTRFDGRWRHRRLLRGPGLALFRARRKRRRNKLAANIELFRRRAIEDGSRRPRARRPRGAEPRQNRRIGGHRRTRRCSGSGCRSEGRSTLKIELVAGPRAGGLSSPRTNARAPFLSTWGKVSACESRCFFLLRRSWLRVPQ